MLCVLELSQSKEQMYTHPTPQIFKSWSQRTNRLDAIESHRRIGVGETSRRGGTGGGRNESQAAVRPDVGIQIQCFLQIVIPRGHTVPGERGAGAAGRKAPGGDSQNAAGV